MALLPPRARYALLALAVVVRMIPLTAVWLTRFLVLRELGVIDTILALLAPVWMGSSPFFVLIFYWSFRRQPVALFEAARLEGMGALRIWASIAMPLARPAVAAVALLTFVQYWSDFMNPLLYLKSDDRTTLALGLRVLQQLDATNWPLLMAGAVVMMLPGAAAAARRAARVLVRGRGRRARRGDRPARHVPVTLPGGVLMRARVLLTLALVVLGPPRAPPSRRLRGSRSWSSATPPRRPPTSSSSPTSRGITRAFRYRSSTSRARATIASAWASTSPPATPADVILLNYRRYGAFAAKGVLEPLGPYLERSRVIREAGLLPADAGAVPLAGHADVHSPEPVEPRRLLQPRSLRPRRRPPSHRGLDVGRLPARGSRADARHPGHRTDRPVRARHRGVDLPPGAVRLAERRRARGRPEGSDPAHARRAAHPRGPAVVRRAPDEAPRGARPGRRRRPRAASDDS